MGRLYEVNGSATGITRFLYDGSDLVAEYNSTGTLLRRYVHGLSAGDDPLVWFEGSSVADSARRYLYADERGSIVAVTNSAGTVLNLNTYDEYGIPGSSNDGRFQYTGQAWIPELGMSYYKARMYSPTLGRFMQTDPIGYGDGMNMYAYVGNDPVNKVDPTGTVQHRCWGYTIYYGTIVDGSFHWSGDSRVYGTCYESPDRDIREPGILPPGKDISDEVTAGPQNNCPLVRPTGNFTVGPNADPRFAPEFASVLSSAFKDLNKRGITPYITSGFRTSADQARMRGGASGSNPAASVSNHQLGLSIDLNTRTPDFPTIRAVLTGAGLTWGGTFRSKDPPHFQLPPAGTRADRAQAAICEAENGR